MTAVPLGKGAWKRTYAGSPQIQLLNRWIEEDPANPREGTSVLARPGTNQLIYLDPGVFAGVNPMRGQYVLSGLFDDALFVVSGQNLYRLDHGAAPIDEAFTITTEAGDALITEGGLTITTEGGIIVQATTSDGLDFHVTHITGTINGTGYPEVAWSKGAGYEQLWISDGTLLQYYAGTTHAKGTLTAGSTPASGVDSVQIGGVYYAWNTAVNAGTPDGTASHPYRVNVGTDPMGNLVKAIMDSGIGGTDYSSTIGGQNTSVSAEVDADNPTTVIDLTAREAGDIGNEISTTVPTGTAVSFSGTHLANGGIEALQGCEVPDGDTPISVTQVSGYVLVAITDSQRFYWINPGEVTIDPLDFASKESSPDNITSMRAVGDQVLIMGEKSTENWYATGDATAPFAPIEGRVYARGVVAGSAVVIDDAVLLIGDDGRAYSIGFQGGDTTDAGWGVTRISNNGIEEQIRKQVRFEEGLTP